MNDGSIASVGTALNVSTWRHVAIAFTKRFITLDSHSTKSLFPQAYLTGDRNDPMDTQATTPPQSPSTATPRSSWTASPLRPSTTLTATPAPSSTPSSASSKPTHPTTTTTSPTCRPPAATRRVA